MTIFTSKTVVLSGTFTSMTRAQAEERLKAAGARIGSDVTRKTDFLIHGENAATKMLKAIGLGVARMTEAEMLAALDAPTPAPTTQTPATINAVTPPETAAGTSELAIFRAAKRAFFESPSYGELRFLKPNEIPAMIKHQPGEALWTCADWVAEEADGAVIGYLRVPGVAALQGPVVHIDNEGQLRLSGACLVDHFGSQTSASHEGDEALEPLRKFCEKHSLPKARTPEVVRALAKATGLDQLDRDFTAPNFSMDRWREQLVETAPGAPTKPVKPKTVARKGTPKRPLQKKDQPTFRSGVTREGHAWFIQPGNDQSTLWVFNGDRCEARTLPGIVSAYGFDGTHEVIRNNAGVLIRDGDDWQVISTPKSFAWGQPFSSHRSGPLYAQAETGELYVLSQREFVRVEVESRPYASMVRDEQGGLYLLGGLTRFSTYSNQADYLIDGKSTALPPLPREGQGFAVVTRGVLCVMDGCWHVYNPATQSWSSSSALNPTARSWVGKLADGRLGYMQNDDRRVHAFEPWTWESTVVGRLPFTPNTSQAIQFNDHGGLVMAGGMLEPRGPNAKVPCEPVLWDKDGARCLAGCDVEFNELLAKAAQNAYEGQSGSIFYQAQ